MILYTLAKKVCRKKVSKFVIFFLQTGIMAALTKPSKQQLVDALSDLGYTDVKVSNKTQKGSNWLVTLSKGTYEGEKVKRGYLVTVNGLQFNQ